MRGAPWEGLFYGFILESMIALGAFVMALGTQDFLLRTLAWLVFGATVIAAVRTVRRVLRQDENPDRPIGRWWFGG